MVIKENYAQNVSIADTIIETIEIIQVIIKGAKWELTEIHLEAIVGLETAILLDTKFYSGIEILYKN